MRRRVQYKDFGVSLDVLWQHLWDSRFEEYQRETISAVFHSQRIPLHCSLFILFLSFSPLNKMSTLA